MTMTDNTYTVEYKLSTEPTVWSNWVVGAAHTTSSVYDYHHRPDTSGADYDVRLTYNDADGVNGTNPQISTPIVWTRPGERHSQWWHPDHDVNQPLGNWRCSLGANHTG